MSLSKLAPVVILCGGMGRRLSSIVSNTQKCLVPINGKPFLDIVVNNLTKEGYHDFIFCVGHFKEQVIEHVSRYQFINTRFSIEEEPLGTGGALKKAIVDIKEENFILVNGDSYCNINFRDLQEFHSRTNPLVTMVLSTAENERKDTGKVIVDKDMRILNYAEKKGSVGQGLVNAGIYVLNSRIVNLMPDSTYFSLEYDVFEKVPSSEFVGFITNSVIYDIGTPERLRSVEDLFAKKGSLI